MNMYFLFSAHVQALFVINRVCGNNLKANNFHWIEYESNYNLLTMNVDYYSHLPLLNKKKNQFPQNLIVNFAFYFTKLLCRLPAFTEATYRDHYPASWNLRHVHFLFDATLNIVDIGKFAHKIIVSPTRFSVGDI